MPDLEGRTKIFEIHARSMNAERGAPPVRPPARRHRQGIRWCARNAKRPRREAREARCASLCALVSRYRLPPPAPACLTAVCLASPRFVFPGIRFELLARLCPNNTGAPLALCRGRRHSSSHCWLRQLGLARSTLFTNSGNP